MRWLNADSRKFLERDYLLPEVSIEQRIEEICKHSENILKINGFAEKLKTIIVSGWCSLSTPIWTNFGNNRGLPISCFGSHISDSMDSILYSLAETGMMTKYGGGTSAYFGEVRSRGSKIKNNGNSSGSVHFIQLFNNIINNISQGNTRRGSFAVYLPIEHGDIEEFLDIKSEGNSIQDIFMGVCVSDDFMNSMINGDKHCRKIWAKVLQKRCEIGLPYIFFTDNVNKNKPFVYKHMPINASNLCSEIMLPSSEEESFVCDLSSLNLLYYDEWKNTDVIETMIYFLDSVMTDFINLASSIKFFDKAVNFAKNHRALGLGVLGWHSLLQSKMVPFESMEAKTLNVEIFKKIDKESKIATENLAKQFGEPSILKGFEQRNTTRLAIAPTTSSSFILGQVSQSIEPINSNYYVKDLAKGKFSYKNPQLKKLLKEKGKSTSETWISILQNDGSVQHLDCLTQEEKDIFKTFSEISQKEIIIQASQRQKYIDQSQSLNLKIHHNTSVKDINKLYIEAWELGIKTLYYQRGFNSSQDLGRNILECRNCQ